MTSFKKGFLFISTRLCPVRYITFIMLGWALSINAFAKPDLLIKLDVPANAVAGGDVGSQSKLVVYNAGNQLARGTESGRNGYMVDLFITRSGMPKGFARFDEKYFDGVLLKGGRYSNTKNLSAGERIVYQSSALLPMDIKAGKYQLCARVDPGKQLSEANEANNTTCVNLKVESRHEVASLGWTIVQQNPVVNHALPPQQTEASTITHAVLEDGTLMLKYPDGSQRRLRPDGKEVYITPEGEALIPLAMQVASDELPELPLGLAQWGGSLTDDLLSILNNILTEPELNAFKKTEIGMDYFDLVEWRLRSISFLTSLESK